ncbi:hypothetical protein K4F52_004544 [Lecanicillium sp. MT-2017a]|nr:hypothetical protein K4F52_004544 [Lecanicillium sp. MT-2017a]
MAHARVKRPFAGASADPAQRQITSFFGNQTELDVTPNEALRQPALPSNIQSNLLSVGMRVRKSVPEGYKTIGTSAFKLWTDGTTPSQHKSAGSSRVVSRELLPFCGINKVGGFESQPEIPSSVFDDVPSEDAVPELTMSQESVESNGPSRKRVYDDDDGDEARLQAFSSGWSDDISPRSSLGNSRVLAVPRSRARNGATAKQMGQENMSINGDFDEADFLVFDEDCDLDMTA